MRALCIIFLTIGCAIVACGITYAASNAGGAEQADIKQAKVAGARDGKVVTLLPKKPIRPPLYDKHYGGARRAAANRPKQSRETRQLHQLFATGNAVNFHDVVSESPARDPKPGLTVRETIHGAPVATASATRRELPSPDDARHHSPNPAAVSGLAYANTHNAVGINGTRVNRKP